MQFTEFIAKVNGLCRKANTKASFKYDLEKNMYIAKCGDVRITGNPTSCKLTVRWGSGHMSTVTV